MKPIRQNNGRLLWGYLIPSFMALVFFLANNIQAQIHIDLKGKVIKKISAVDSKKKIEPGTQIKLTEIFRRVGDVSTNISIFFKVEIGKEKYTIKEKDLKRIELINQNTLSDLWSRVLIKESEVYQKLLEEGMHYSLRRKSDLESIKFIDTYFEYDLFFDDPYLEEYLQSLLPSIHPVTLSDKRPGNLAIKVVIDSSPNAYCLPNGTIMITTGMLSLIDSEDELIAIITHEAAHFVLDHYINNILTQIKLQKRAEFWAAFATTMAAAGDAYLASQNSNHKFGVITASTAVMSYSIAKGVRDRLGLEYSQHQEQEADKVAVMVLNHLGISPNALSTVFKKLMNYSISIGDYSSFSSKGTHPSITSRIKATGTPDPNAFIDQSYYLTISNASTNNAYLEFYNHHYKEADRIISRNITSNIATEDDYILKARLLRNLFNTEPEMKQALNYLLKAESLNVTPRSVVYKGKGLTYMRLGDYSKAKEDFNTYLSCLESKEYKSSSDFKEIDWTRKMIYKCSQI